MTFATVIKAKKLRPGDRVLVSMWSKEPTWHQVMTVTTQQDPRWLSVDLVGTYGLLEIGAKERVVVWR